jgi:IS5 family transposase
MGDPLEKLDKVINWKTFKPVISKAFRIERKSNAGRPPFDYLMMFKIVVLQHMYNLSDAQVEYQLLDRLTFRRFAGLGTESVVPDEKTIWLFRETLSKRGAITKLFDMFDRYLIEAGFHAKKGMMVDASFVEVPRQRNTRDENDQIKNGGTPSVWEQNPDKLAQKDLDARWTKKNDQTFYGYKNHVDVDVKHKLIRAYVVTPANVHDSQALQDVLDPDNTNQSVWADSAYSSAEIEERLADQGIKNCIHRKSYRDHPLSECQRRCNTKKSRIRARVEHVFAQIDRMVGRWIRCIGQRRAAAKIGILNLVYNMRRYAFLASHA